MFLEGERTIIPTCCISIQNFLNRAKAVIRINLPITHPVFSGISRCPAFFSKKQKSSKTNKNVKK